jgi:hypothetical protein
MGRHKTRKIFLIWLAAWKSQRPCSILVHRTTSWGMGFLFFYVGHFEKTYATLKEPGIMFLEDPRNET